MTVKKFSPLFAVLALVLTAVPATAATISLSPASTTVAAGDTVSFALMADFTADPTLGGGLDVFFNSAALGFVAFEFDDPASVGDDPDFRRAPDALAGELNGIGFGNFDGIEGIVQIGILTFEALAVGDTSITMAANEGGPPDNPGGFFSLAGTPQSVDFVGADVAVVPLPAGLLLLFSALGALGAVRSRP